METFRITYRLFRRTGKTCAPRSSTTERAPRPTLARLIDAVAYYWLVRGHYREGDEWIQVALTDDRPTEPALSVEWLVWQSDFARITGDLDRSLTVAEQALAQSRALDDERLVVRSSTRSVSRTSRWEMGRRRRPHSRRPLVRFDELGNRLRERSEISGI